MLKTFTIESIYKNRSGQRVNLPIGMSLLVDTGADSLLKLKADVESMGGNLYLSDGYRSKTQQEKAHNDYITKKKKAFSPPAGYSYHEAGRAIDIDLEAIHMPLSVFWTKAKKYGWMPVIPQPISNQSEAWHFEYREYWNLLTSYSIGKRCAVLEAYLFLDIPITEKDGHTLFQGLMYLLGFYKGAIDGSWGPLSKEAYIKAVDSVGSAALKPFAAAARKIILEG